MTDIKEKIYFLLPNLGGGGVEKIVTSMSYYMEKYEVNFVLFENIITYPYHGKIHILDIGVGNKLGLLGKIKKFYLSIVKLYKFKKDNNVDVMMSFMPLSNFINVITKRKKKVLISVRANPSLELKSLGAYKYIYKLLTKYLYQKADKIIVISNSIRNDLIKHLSINSKKIETIYNPINIDVVSNKANEEIKNNKYKSIFDNLVIVTVGRLAEQKGQWHLIRVFSQLIKKRPDLKLLIIGDGPLRRQLVTYSISLGLETYCSQNADNENLKLFNVFFIGFEKNPYQFIKHSTVFTFPSLYEGFGNVITESMACGTPVIAADCESGPREILQPHMTLNKTLQADQYFGNFGVLLPSFMGSVKDIHKSYKNDKVWEEALDKLLDDESMRNELISNGMNRIKDFSIENITPLYVRHFKNDNK